MNRGLGVKIYLKNTFFLLITCFTFLVPLYAKGDVAFEQKEPPAKEESPQYNSLDSLFTLYQPYLVNIEAYEPIYFILGSDPSKSKFQISLKYRMISNKSSIAEKYPWVRGFQVAYTQTSFWDLSSQSAPFDDTSYKPEFFFLSPNLFFQTDKILRLFIQTGLLHESNGQAAEYSRSTNMAYLKPMFVYYNEPHKMGFQLSLKAWMYYNNDDETNPDLADYRGFFELGFKFGFAEVLVIDNTYRYAKRGGSYRLDVSYPLSKYIFEHVDMYFYTQYVYSLSERLIDYRRRSEAFRLGFAIVR